MENNISQNLLSLTMGIWTTIVGIFTDNNGNDHEETMDSAEYEYSTVTRLINRFSGFAGVYVTDSDGNDLDLDDLPHHNAPDGGADCLITVEPEDYTERGFRSMCTRVRNILDSGDF
tara:strand:- start:5761 stop:6111 length:351 start_codon:yes stop_codon:yes gene_type:complete